MDFELSDAFPISRLFRQKHVYRFADACAYVKQMPYGRNTDKLDLERVFLEGRGTCSTKHALLWQVAQEQQVKGVQLQLALFRMSGQNTPKVAKRLQEYGLVYLPEAHNYLRVQGEIIDCTWPGLGAEAFLPDLLEEISIGAQEIGAFKVAWHREALQRWLLEHAEIPYGLEEIWQIRELCISDLGD